MFRTLDVTIFLKSYYHVRCLFCLPLRNGRTRMCGTLTGDFALTSHGCATASYVEVPHTIKKAGSSFDSPAGDLSDKAIIWAVIWAVCASHFNGHTQSSFSNLIVFTNSTKSSRVTYVFENISTPERLSYKLRKMLKNISG